VGRSRTRPPPLPKDVKPLVDGEKTGGRATDIIGKLESLIQLRMSEFANDKVTHEKASEVLFSLYLIKLIKKSMEFIPIQRNQTVQTRFSDCLEIMDDLMLGSKARISVLDKEKLFNEIVVPGLKMCFALCGKSNDEYPEPNWRGMKEEVRKMILDVRGIEEHPLK